MEVSFKMRLLEKMRIEDAFNSKPNYVDLINLVRSIQRSEGNIDCYRRGRRECDRLNCYWRDHCLKKPEGSSKGSESHDRAKAANPKQEQESLH